MTDSRLSAPPPGTHICGGSWEKMPTESRRELWKFYDRLVARQADKGKPFSVRAAEGAE